MNFFLIVAACMVAATAASECGILQKLKVKRQWAQAFGVSEEREAMGLAVFRYIYSKKPETPTKYFRRVRGEDMHSPEFTAHIGRILSGFDMCISLLDEEASLNDQLNHLEKQHESMNISADYFDIFGQGLELAVHSLLGRCYDDDAWTACINLIENGIKKH